MTVLETTPIPVGRRIDQTAPTGRGGRRQRLNAPPRPRLLTSDVLVVIFAVVAITTALWWRNGGLDTAFDSLSDLLSSIGRLTGLYAALAALAGLILAARPRGLERRFGLDRMLVWHRIVGITTVALVTVHAVVDTIAWGMPTGENPIAALIDLVANQPWMLAALMGTLLFLAVGLTSWRRIKQRIAYETWYYIHLTGYLAVLLAFGHQITLGTDLVGGGAGLAWWLFISIGAFAWVLWARTGDFVRSLTRGPLTVAKVTRESPEMGALHITGPGMRGMRAEAGQFFHLRILTKGLWWQTHPFSLSAAPTTDGLRFTVKDLGDGSHDILSLRPRTPVLLEGPYGSFTARESGGRRVVLFGAGAGIGPIRSVLEDLTPDQEPVVILRGRREEDLVHREEIEALVAARNGRVHLLVGPRVLFGDGDPFHPRLLRKAVPDIATRDAYLCGPESFEYAVEKSLRAIRVPGSRIHRERFGV